MYDTMQIGSTPYNMDCAQVGSENYDTKSQIECNAFLHQIKRVCGEPPQGARLVVKSFPHDFGSYREVCVVYDAENEVEPKGFRLPKRFDNHRADWLEDAHRDVTALGFIPERPEKIRTSGLTMVMDKGLSLNEATNLVSVAGHLIDFVKLGFGTSAISNDVKKKIRIYKDAKIKNYLGGTLFEAFAIRNMVDDYKELIEDWELNAVEISDGSMIMDHKKKCEYISSFTDKYTVLSEVGCKDAKVSISDNSWLSMMKE